MVVAKELIGWAETVAVDPSEILALPSSLRNAVRGKPGATPKVVLLNPQGTQVYGVYNHEEMKSRKWKELFGDAQKAMAKDQAAGTFVKADKIVNIEGATLDDWESSAGTAIKAKLTSIEDDSVFVFELAGGRVIRTNAEQLSADSVKKALALTK